jgi:FtsP/CotA-like multicopper oxidase with cupredoxin domain/DNA-directed RNA polymerase subunit RPC12/RpoP
MHHHTHSDPLATESFPTDPSGLPEAGRPQLLELAPGDTLELQVGPVAKRLGDTTVRMLGYNSSIPGPTLKVAQGSEIIVHVTNNGDLDTTVHWHGLRLENKYDGVPHETQAPIPVGGEFTYRIQFPDAGLYWYHPHIREDYTQELGLYGNILVVPSEPDYWLPVDRDFILTVDDLLVEDGKVAPFSPTETSYAAMGRFGNVFLTSGDPDLRLEARAGEVVRLWLTNTANTRVFNLTMPGARMKQVGGDSGRVEREEFIEGVLLAPSERAVVDVLVERPGELHLEHHTPDRTYRLATLTVAEDEAGPSAAAGEFEVLRRAPELAAERRGLDRWLAAPPDKVLALVAQMDDPAAMPAGAGPVTYACPMHPEVTSTEPGRCPKCGMKLLATQAPAATAYACPMHPEVVSDQPGRCPKCGMKLLATAAPASYVCPMHPEVTSDTPGHCPKCGMKLLAAESVPKPAAAAATGAMDDHGGQTADHDHDGHHGAGHRRVGPGRRHPAAVALTRIPPQPPRSGRADDGNPRTEDGRVRALPRHHAPRHGRTAAGHLRPPRLQRPVPAGGGGRADRAHAHRHAPHGHRRQDLRRGTRPGRGARPRWRRPDHQGHGGSGDR